VTRKINSCHLLTSGPPRVYNIPMTPVMEIRKLAPAEKQGLSISPGKGGTGVTQTPTREILIPRTVARLHLHPNGPLAVRGAPTFLPLPGPITSPGGALSPAKRGTS